MTKGYRIKVGKNSYILFKKEDYLNLFFLEKVYFDFYNNLFFKRDEKIRSFFRLSLIQKYIESLSQIEIVILCDRKKTKNPFDIKFPNVGFLGFYDLIDIEDDEICEKMKDFGNEDLKNKYFDSILLLRKVIRVKYLKRNRYHNNSFDVRRVHYMPE